jgi:FMN reductase
MLRRMLESVEEKYPVIHLRVYDLGLPAYEPGRTQAGHGGLSRFAEAVAASIAVAVATPVYQDSVSGVLKNALDHVHDMKHQPVGLVGRVAATIAVAEGAKHGTALAHLRTILTAMGAAVLPGGVSTSASSFEGTHVHDPVVSVRLEALAQDLLETLTAVNADGRHRAG